MPILALLGFMAARFMQFPFFQMTRPSPYNWFNPDMV